MSHNLSMPNCVKSSFCFHTAHFKALNKSKVFMLKYAVPNAYRMHGETKLVQIKKLSLKITPSLF